MGSGEKKTMAKEMLECWAKRRLNESHGHSGCARIHYHHQIICQYWSWTRAAEKFTISSGWTGEGGKERGWSSSTTAPSNHVHRTGQPKRMQNNEEWGYDLWLCIFQCRHISNLNRNCGSVRRWLSERARALTKSVVHSSEHWLWLSDGL